LSISGLRLRATPRPAAQKPAYDSVIDCFFASVIGRMLAADSIYSDQEHYGDDHDQNKY
jgi:hypothetical protein